MRTVQAALLQNGKVLDKQGKWCHSSVVTHASWDPGGGLLAVLTEDGFEGLSLMANMHRGGDTDFMYKRNNSVLRQVKLRLWKRHHKSKRRQFKWLWHLFFSLRKSAIYIPLPFQVMRYIQAA